MLSTPSPRSARHLSLPTLSAPSSLSGFSLTRAKYENGTKRAFEDRKPFLRLKLEKSRERLEERLIQSVKSRIEAQNRARKPKTSAFKRILGLGVISSS